MPQAGATDPSQRQRSRCGGNLLLSARAGISLPKTQITTEFLTSVPSSAEGLGAPGVLGAAMGPGGVPGRPEQAALPPHVPPARAAPGTGSAGSAEPPPPPPDMDLRAELLKSIWYAFTALDVEKSGKVSKSQLKVSPRGAERPRRTDGGMEGWRGEASPGLFCIPRGFSRSNF